MAPQYTIKANVVNILKDTPKANDTFLVDSNVWYWMTYSRATCSLNQKNSYPSYLNQALSVGARIHYCGLSLAELAHTIERAEREIYENINDCKMLPKEYRHNPIQRLNIISELQTVWNQVKSMATPLSVMIDSVTTDAALVRFQNEYVDGYDLFILESMKKHGITNIITDDADFATTSGIQVITGNRNVLTAAQKQQKLIKR